MANLDKEAKKSDKKKKKSGLTAAIWVVFTLIILILFLVKQNDIKTVLKETDFFKYVFGQNPEFIEKFETEKKPSENSTILANENDTQTEFTLSDEKDLVQDESKIVTEPSSLTESVDKVAEQKTSSDKVIATSDIPETESSNTIKEPKIVEKRNEYLCFVVIEGNGSLTRKDVNRQITKTDTPLNKALNDLLEGPSYEDASDGFISLIPSGTRLISATIKNTVATINFSSEFLYNKYGVDGFRGQLMQVVYTATYFDSIKSVQILINGEKTDFLGSEGVWIGSPLTRFDF